MRREATTLLIAAVVLAASVGLAACGDERRRWRREDAQPDDRGHRSADRRPGDFGPPGRKAADLAVVRSRRRSEGGRRPTVRIQHEDEQTKPRPQSRRRASSSTPARAASPARGRRRTRSRSRGRSRSARGSLQISPASTGRTRSPTRGRRLPGPDAPPPDNAPGPTLAGAIEKQLGGAQGKTVNIGARNDAYGSGLRATRSGSLGGEGRRDRREGASTTPSSRATTRRPRRSRRATPTPT